MTHSSAGIATSCRCAQATNRRPSKSYEQTYSHQFEHRQMIDLMQNVGEFEGTAIAKELTHTCACTPARARPMDCSRLCTWSSQQPRLSAMSPTLPPISRLEHCKHVIKMLIPTLSGTLGQLCACLRPQKSGLTPSPPRPRIRGASPKYLPLFRQKEFSCER